MHALVGLSQDRTHPVHATLVLHHIVQDWHQIFGKTVFLQHLKASERMSRGEKFQCFVKQARRRNMPEQATIGLHRIQCVRLGLKTEFSHETQHAQHTHRVFAKARFRLADDAQHLIVQITYPAVIIEYHLALHVVVQRIDRHVAARGVRLDIAIDVIAQYASVFIGFLIFQIIRAKGSNLNQIALVQHMHDAKTSPNDARATKQFQYLLGARVGRHVKILRNVPKHQIAHRAANDIGLKTRFAQSFADHARRLGNVTRIDAVFFRRIRVRFMQHRLFRSRFEFFARFA